MIASLIAFVPPVMRLSSAMQLCRIPTLRTQRNLSNPSGVWRSGVEEIQIQNCGTAKKVRATAIEFSLNSLI